MERFERQIKLKGFGIQAQQRLIEAKVLIIGAGGLGCPVLLYLAAAGVGNITIIDGDLVSISNLNRQIIFSESDVNKSKAEVAATYIRNKYADIQVNFIPSYLTNQNALRIISEYDLIIDGTDNFGTRYMINDVCTLMNKPLVFGSIYQNEGQVAVFNVKNKQGIQTNYRDVFPTPPSDIEVPNCSETGVLGVLPGIIGLWMAAEAIKFISQYGHVLLNKMMIYDLYNHAIQEIQLKPNKQNIHAPKTIDEFLNIDYKITCSSNEASFYEVSWPEVLQIIKNAPADSILIDIREPHEQPKLEHVNHINMVLQHLLDNPQQIQSYKTVYLFCQKGIRSKYATTILKKHLPDTGIFSIIGGISQIPDIQKFKKYAE